MEAQDEHLQIVKQQRDRYEALYRRAKVETKMAGPGTAANATDMKKDDSVFLTQTGVPLQVKLSDTEAALQDALVRLELARRDAEAAREREAKWRVVVEQQEQQQRRESNEQAPGKPPSPLHRENMH